MTALSAKPMSKSSRSLMPPPRHPESARLLGLLVAVAVLALVSRWLLPSEPAERAASPLSLERSDPAPTRGLRLAEAHAEPAPPALRKDAPARQRPVSAAWCHALDEKMKALDARADGSLDKAEQRALRAERRRGIDLLFGLRCHPNGGGYWF